MSALDPKIGETVYDGAVGSAGFLCEAYDYMNKPGLSGSDWETLQTKRSMDKRRRA